MIDEKKIEEATRDYINKNGYFVKYDEDPCVDIELAYKEGAKWAINESLKDLCHPASEVPQIGRGRVLAYSIDCCYRNLYNLYDMMSKTDCNTYQEMWELEVKAYNLDGWIYADELFKLVIEGGDSK